MKFSIIVPVYNAEKYLAESIASVLRQSFSDFELILVDDGSASDCARLCDAAAEKAPQICVIHQKNAGQLFARLRGIEEAKGEYCLFLDADDLLFSDCLQKLNDAIDRYSAPDMLIYSYASETADGTRQEKPPVFENERMFSAEDKEELYRLCFSGSSLNTVWTKAVKRTVLNGDHPDYQRFASLRCAEDRVHAMVMLDNADTIVYLPERLYVYRLAEGSTTREFSVSALDRFNTAVLYPFEIECLQKWGLYSDEALKQLDASYLAQTLYVFDLFFRNLPDRDNKNALIDYPWQSHLPGACLEAYMQNPCLNDVQKELLTMLLNKDKKSLYAFFKRKKRIKALRSLKRKLIP